MRAKKFGAMAMAMAMAATMMPMSTFAQEEETYDFGGAEVRVFGNKWNDLDPDADRPQRKRSGCGRRRSAGTARA